MTELQAPSTAAAARRGSGFPCGPHAPGRRRGRWGHLCRGKGFAAHQEEGTFPSELHFVPASALWGKLLLLLERRDHRCPSPLLITCPPPTQEPLPCAVPGRCISTAHGKVPPARALQGPQVGTRSPPGNAPT